MFPRRDMEAEELQKAEAQKEIHEKLFLRALVVLKCSLWIFWDLFDTLTKQINFKKSQIQRGKDPRSLLLPIVCTERETLERFSFLC